ncbi:MAG: trypsin-like peptidase domain-containing protein [Acidimicrobiales bacterium]
MDKALPRPALPVFADEPDPTPPGWRERLLPKSVLGMAVVLLAAAIGASLSGAVLYAYYEYRLNQNENRIAQFTAGFDERFQQAVDIIAAEREQARADIRKELEPLQRITAEGSTLEALVRKTEPALWFVATLDEAGQPSVGSAFAVASDASQTYLLASYTTVRAATRAPGPAVNLRKGTTEVRATLWSWQEERDLALLILPRGNQPRLEFAAGPAPAKVGERLFALSGLGALGGGISQGFVGDVSAAGLQHDAAVGPAFQGGPLVNSNGEVLAIASRAYAPLGFASDAVFFGIPAKAACERVLRCPGDTPAGAGAGDRR